jgi:hypothetical protein
MPVDKLTIQQFAQKVKAKYPEYKDVNDSVLVEKMISKYPEYKDKISHDQPPPLAAKSEGPAFKPMTDWLSMPQQGYQPMDQANVVPIDDHTKNTAQAADRVRKEVETIDPHIRNLIYEKKSDLSGRIKSQELGINPKEAGPLNLQAAQLGSQLREEIQVAPEEVEEFKIAMNENPVMARQGLNQKVKDFAKSDPVRASMLKGDIYRLDRQANPEKEESITKNIDKINSGEYDYDIVNGRLIKPLGFFGSVINAFKEKGKAFDDYDVYQSGDEKKILDRIKQRLNDDPDKATPTPIGAMGEAGAILGGQPLKPLIGGAIAGVLSDGLAAPAAAAAISAPEMYKLTFGTALPSNYGALKKQNPELPDSEVLQLAIDLTNKQANADALSGAAMGAIGARAALKPTTALLLQESVKSALKQIGETVAIEGLGGGAIAAGGQYVKNIMAQKAGISVDESEGMTQQLVGGVFMTLGMSLAGKAGNLLKPSTYNKLLHGLSALPEEVIVNEFARAQELGALTPEEVQRVQTDISEQKKVDASIRGDVPEPDRIKVQEKIKQRDLKEKELETSHKAYHPEIKEEIKKLDEQILLLSKGSERGELQQLIDKSKIDGAVKAGLRDLDEKELKDAFREIAEQAHDPLSENQTLLVFGEEIVNKAKELYPKEEPKPSSISVIQPGDIKQPETITISPREQPAKVGSTENVSVIMPRSNVQEGGVGSPKAEEPILLQNEQALPSQEETAVPVGEGKVGEPDMIGITHAQMDALSEELGLPTYEKSPEKVAEWDQQAAKKLQEPDALNNLFKKLRNAELPDPVETRMMVRYMADLKAKVDKDPYNKGLQDQLLRTRDIFNIAGRLQGKSLVARKGSIPVEETLSDFILRDRETNKAPLTDEQITQASKEFDEIKKAKDEFEQKVANLQAENTKLKAEKKVKEQVKATKTQPKKDYQTERKQIVNDIREKLRKARGESKVVIVPYANELIAIAPDVARLVKSYIEQGVHELPELVKAVHSVLKDDINEITEKDVHNIIAGEYNAKKPTRNQLAQQLFDVRREAQLINELEQLQSGQAPKSQNKKIQRNQKIEKLKEQINDLKDEMGLSEKTDTEKLSALKARYKKQIGEIESKISKGDYGPDEKPIPIKLDKEAQDLKDEYIRLKQGREKRLAQQEYDQRSKFKKGLDWTLMALNTPRTVMASMDFSAPLRQGIVATISHPSTAAKAFVEMFKQAKSQKEFDRWLVDLKERPEYKVMEDAGLYVADPNNLHLSAKEEQYMGSLVDKYSVLNKTIGRPIHGSERAYVAYLNKMRVDIFRQGADVFESQGRTIENSPELYKGLANYINNATGRGGLGPLDKAAPILNVMFFSPRLIASRINLLNLVYYAKLPKEVRLMALKDMGKLIAFGATLLGLAAAAGADVEKDPRSSDYGKIKVGNTRWDVWGGFQQYIRLASQVLTGKTKSTTSGEIRELRGDVFPYKSRLDQTANFFRGKLAPVPGTALDLLAGRNMMGEEFDPANKAYELFTPMIVQDVREAWKDQGFASLFTVGVPSSFGVGVSTYGSKSGGMQQGESGKIKTSKNVKTIKN